MKKIIFVLLLIVNLFCMSACEGIAPYPFQFEEEVIRVELIDYENSDAKELSCPTIFHHIDQSEILAFDFNKMTVIETLSQESLDEFLGESDFTESGVFLTDPDRYLDSPQGLCLRIVYASGSFEIISYDELYAGSFYADGSVKRFIGICLGGEELINKYFYE